MDDSDISAKTLIQLQRLARVVKKVTHTSVSLARKGGMSALLSMAYQQRTHPDIKPVYDAFLNSLNVKERQWVGQILPDIFAQSPDDDTISYSDNKARYERRQRDIPVKHDRRKGIFYRGAWLYEDRRQEQRPFKGKDRRGTGEASLSKVKVIRADAQADENETAITYRGVRAPLAHEKQEPRKSSQKKKSTRMYRGVEIKDEE